MFAVENLERGHVSGLCASHDLTRIGDHGFTSRQRSCHSPVYEMPAGQLRFKGSFYSWLPPPEPDPSQDEKRAHRHEYTERRYEPRDESYEVTPRLPQCLDDRVPATSLSKERCGLVNRHRQRAYGSTRPKVAKASLVPLDLFAHARQLS